MATARSGRGSRHGRRTTAQRTLDALRWTWAVAFSLLFIVVGVALVLAGALFAIVGAEAVLRPDNAGHAIAGVLFAVVGLAAIAGGVALAFRLRSRLGFKLSGRKPPKSGNGSSGYFGGSFFGGDGCGGGDSGGGGGGDGGGGGSC